MKLPNKMAVITGAGRGIGKCIALSLAKAGANVAVIDVDLTAATEVKDEILKIGVQAQAFNADVTSSQDIKSTFDDIEARLGKVDILVNNAGVGGSAMVVDMTDAEWNRAIQVNLTGTFNCSREAVKRMIPRRWGRIINISSLAAKRISLFGGAAYTASKSGVLGLTRHLAYEVAPFGITVNAVCPGETMTDMTMEKFTTEQLKERIKMNPSGRLAIPEDHAALVLYFASDYSDMITGQAVDVDGGSLLAWLDFGSYVKARQRV